MIALFSDYFYGKIRTSQFAKFTCYAILRSCSKCFFLRVEFKHIFRAEMYTNTTSLAPVPVYPMFFQFRFLPHVLVPGFWFERRTSYFVLRCSWFDMYYSWFLVYTLGFDFSLQPIAYPLPFASRLPPYAFPLDSLNPRILFFFIQIFA